MKNLYPCIHRSLCRTILIGLILSLPISLAANVEPPPTFLAKWGSLGTGDGQFRHPWGVAIDSADNVHVVDTRNHRIQKFDSDSRFLTKWGSYGTGDGQFNSPMGVVVDSWDNVYVADTSNHRIQKFDSDGRFLTKWGSLGNGDGQFYNPSCVAIDSADNIYVVDTYNNRIQKFIPRSIRAEIDITPGSNPNSINPKSKGKIPVAILTTDTLDATSVDSTTVFFGARKTKAHQVHSALEDVDKDGDIDMILHFKIQDTGIECGDNSAFLSGKTSSGQPIEGAGVITTVGCH